MLFFGADRTARKKKAFVEPLCEPYIEITTQVKLISVDGIPTFWDEDRVLRDAALGALFHLITVRDAIGDIKLFL
jgi:hypothetical protein